MFARPSNAKQPISSLGFQSPFSRCYRPTISTYCCSKANEDFVCSIASYRSTNVPRHPRLRSNFVLFGMPEVHAGFLRFQKRGICPREKPIEISIKARGRRRNQKRDQKTKVAGTPPHRSIHGKVQTMTKDDWT